MNRKNVSRRDGRSKARASHSTDEVDIKARHLSVMLASLAALQRSAAHCDVLLQPKSTTSEAAREAAATGVWAHRAVLGAASPYFHNIFHNSDQQCKKIVVTVPGVTTKTLRMLVDNVYMPTSLSVTVKEGRSLLAAAARLSVEDVRNEASTCLAHSLATDNVLGIFHTAKSHNCSALTALAENFIQKNGERVLQVDELLSLQPSMLGELLAGGTLAAPAQSALKAVLRWTMHRPQERRQHLSSLLEVVQLPQVPRPLLLEVARAEPITNNAPALRLVILATFTDSDHDTDHETDHDTQERSHWTLSRSEHPGLEPQNEVVLNQCHNTSLQEERMYIRKKTFTKWINSFLKKDCMEVNDLFVDLADGRQLHKLLEIVSGERLPRLNSGQMKIHKTENVKRCIQFLRSKVRLESIDAEGIVDGNPLQILNLIWTIIQRFQIQEIEIKVDEDKELSKKKYSSDALLLWCQRKTSGYQGVNIKNFTDSWRSGLGFNALIHTHRPDLFNWLEVPTTDHEDMLNHAFDVAHRSLAVPRLLDAEDVDISAPDEESIMTYLACYYHTFISTNNEQSGRSVDSNMDESAVRAVEEYINSPTSLTVTVDKAQALMTAAASLLGVDGVRDAVCESLKRALTADNALGIRAFAELHACAALAAAAASYVNTHFEHVLQADEFLALAPDALATLLESLAISDEEHVLDAVLRWTQHRPQERQQHLFELLRHVRLHLLSPEELAKRASTELLSTAEPRVRCLFLDALVDHHKSSRSRALSAAGSEWHRPRQHRAADSGPHALLVMGGYMKNIGDSSDVLSYELSTGRWQSAGTLPVDRAGAGVAVLDGRVYVVGGSEGFCTVNTVFVYDVARGSWSSGPSLITKRSRLTAAALDGVLYAVGGQQRDSLPQKIDRQDFRGAFLRSAEAFDPREGVWRSIASMSTGRVDLGVATLNRRLYAAGGQNINGSLNTVERYGPSSGRWEPVDSMAERRSRAAVCVVDDVLYAAGGRNESTTHRSVERYRAGLGWEPAPSMITARYDAAVATHADRLYIAGGYSDRDLSSVEVFFPSTATWSELPAAMPAGRWAAAAVVVQWPPPAP